ncbi:hypothetical protein HMN09_01136300 [Mycena chlorophos]|uniref:Uncharacterized protein n=1 Tax=Mycena chlorophos TaxID=658473 RepID=A0A8H6VZE8_MYCCL|nr:hypothetical protein HMN09_01136300 [Mycena chlorophos]
MFPPFSSVSEFYPGLIIWCIDPYELPTSSGPTYQVDTSKHDQRPCLVVAVNAQEALIQIARFSETVPFDPRQWVRIDTAPALTWKHADAWIWVGKPATVRIVLGKAKYMHPHKDTSYTNPPISTQNVDAYWTHRKRFIAATSAVMPDPHQSFKFSPFSPPPSSTSSSSGSPDPSRGPTPLPVPMLGLQSGYAAGTMHPDRRQHQQFTVSPYSPSPSPHPYMHHNQVYTPPPGFTQTNPERQGWLRNPDTGYLWHPALGFVPPEAEC